VYVSRSSAVFFLTHPDRSPVSLLLCANRVALLADKPAWLSV